MTTDASLRRRDRTVAAWLRVLGILSLIAAAAACGSDPPPIPDVSETGDAARTAEAAQEAPNTQTTQQDEAAPADADGDRFDIDEATTMREVFDTLAGAEQDCIRGSVDDSLLEAALDAPALSDDEHTDRFSQSVLSCVDAETAREFFIAVMVADTAAKAGVEGLSAPAGEGIKTCLRSLLANVDVAAWLSGTEMDEQTSDDDELLSGLFACGLDLEMEWTVSGAESGCECDVTDGDCDIAHCEGEVTITTSPVTVTPDDTGYDAGDSGLDDHGDGSDWATYVEVGWAVEGAIDHDGDIDFFVFWAEQGTLYWIDVTLGTLPDSTVALYDDGSFELAFNDDYTDNGDTTASRISWQAEYTGEHFVAVESYDTSAGTYTVAVTFQ